MDATCLKPVKIHGVLENARIQGIHTKTSVPFRVPDRNLLTDYIGCYINFILLLLFYNTFYAIINKSFLTPGNIGGS